VPSSSTPESTACEPVLNGRPSAEETCDRIIREQIPNFFRLYLNPFLVQTCYCLSRYVETTWYEGRPAEPGHPSFLANSFDEALSGAIKLARFLANQEGRSPAGLVIDRGGRLGPFAGVTVALPAESADPGQARIEFIPQLKVAGAEGVDLDALVGAGERFGFVVLVATSGPSLDRDREALWTLVHAQAPLVITCIDRPALGLIRQSRADLWRELVPDIVVFDESFVERQVPFAAFTTRKALYDPWSTGGRSTFHSTTYQPNAISSMHFLRCLPDADPEFWSAVAPGLERLDRDPAYRARLLATLYSPSLARAMTALGLDTPHVRASGHYIAANGRTVFDGVAGVACSVRGHNPESYVQEVEDLEDVPDCPQAVADVLKELTSLECVLPAVSGANAVENALRLALVAQYPRRYVLAFQGGFAGKTLLALTGTANPVYRAHLDPLYENVIYLDPFAPTALEDLEAVLRDHPVAVVQLELIQAVGGVRPIPPRVLQYLQENKPRWGYLLFIDEVQTGMYRTGPFALSEKLGLTPDLLTVGKAACDMMFPFALTLYSAAIQRRLDEAQPDLVPSIRRKFGHDLGYRTVLNVLTRARTTGLAERVAEAGALFAALLKEGLAGCKAVRDVRVHGLLIGIELDTARWPRRWFRKRLGSFYLLGMLRHRPFPLLIGFCQYEPNVLKLTPPLSITPEEVRQVCATITAVLKRPFYKVLLPGLGALLKPLLRRRWKLFHPRG
jgi:acetylornithine/succinyldiaminopimelate/putrescine aminotransferase